MVSDSKFSSEELKRHKAEVQAEQEASRKKAVDDAVKRFSPSRKPSRTSRFNARTTGALNRARQPHALARYLYGQNRTKYKLNERTGKYQPVYSGRKQKQPKQFRRILKIS